MIVARRRLGVCCAGVLMELSVDRLLERGELVYTGNRIFQRPLPRAKRGLKRLRIAVVFGLADVIDNRTRARAPRFGA